MKLFTLLFKALSPFASMMLIRRGRKAGHDWVQLQKAALVVKGVRGARLAFLGVIALTMLMMLLGGGFALLHIGLFLLLPSPANVVTLLALGAIYTIVGILILAKICSEKTWMQVTGAGKMAAQALRQANRQP